MQQEMRHVPSQVSVETVLLGQDGLALIRRYVLMSVPLTAIQVLLLSRFVLHAVSANMNMYMIMRMPICKTPMRSVSIMLDIAEIISHASVVSLFIW